MIVAVTVSAPVTDEGESETDAPPVMEGVRVSVPAPAASPALATNVTVADGFRMVPHLPEYFLDNLHPNALGAEVYGRNLAEFIRETGF